jgi:hypothetical protein
MGLYVDYLPKVGFFRPNIVPENFLAIMLEMGDKLRDHLLSEPFQGPKER